MLDLNIYMYTYFSSKYSLLDAATSGQLGFQDPASPIAEGLVDLHDYIFFFIILVIFFVFWMLYVIVLDFNEYNYNDISTEEEYELLAGNYVLAQGVVHGAAIEIIWTLIPTFILVAIAVPSFGLLYAMDEIIPANLTFKAIGHQWYWTYEYTDYLVSNPDFEGLIFDSYMVPEEDLNPGEFRLLEVDNRVVLPTNVHIRVIITSADVLHCWAVPSLGVKMDAVPGRLNMSSLFIKREGLYFGQCSELCGVNHGFMPIAVEAVSLPVYLDWLDSERD